MKQPITIVKVGGAVLEDEKQLNILLEHFSSISGNKILVHGGGRKATQIASLLNIDTQMINGRRITNKDMLDVVTMVYGGLVNKTVVAKLQARGVNAIGLTGADANTILAHKRPIKNGIDYGYAGDVDNVDGNILQQLLIAGLTPVMAPLSHNGLGSMLNTNADTIAAETSKALADKFNVTLIYCFEKNGVLSDPENDNSIIPIITQTFFEKEVEKGTISGGMIPKLKNALEAVDAGVERVIITNATASNWEKGTVVKKE